MSLIKNKNELAMPTTVKMMIYGQAGSGKTSLALSAPQPLLLDFDGGVNRVNSSHLDGVGIVQVSNWQEALSVLQEDLSAFRTVVVDTAGKMMDFIINYKCGSRSPSIRDWSGINAEFNNFTRALSMLGKNVIYIAHRDINRDGDDTVYIPMLRAKNFSAIVTELDLLGYMETRLENGKLTRTITFDPTNRSEGKNACNLPGIMNIPQILDANGNPTAKNDFIQTNVLAPYFAMLASKKEQQQKYEAVLKEITDAVDLITNPEEAKAFADGIDQFAHVGASKAIARQKFSKRLAELGIKYNSKTKSYEQA